MSIKKNVIYHASLILLFYTVFVICLFFIISTIGLFYDMHQPFLSNFSGLVGLLATPALTCFIFGILYSAFKRKPIGPLSAIKLSFQLMIVPLCLMAFLFLKTWMFHQKFFLDEIVGFALLVNLIFSILIFIFNTTITPVITLLICKIFFNKTIKPS